MNGKYEWVPASITFGPALMIVGLSFGLIIVWMGPTAYPGALLCMGIAAVGALLLGVGLGAMYRSLAALLKEVEELEQRLSAMSRSVLNFESGGSVVEGFYYAT